ncbi:MAG: ABC transporter substrate-binding protein [Desulfobacterales bacterium]|nr:ABC transporter substrate-binding protein [Desulfobacterales bacterium]
MKTRYVFLRMITLVSIMSLLGSVPSYAEEVRGVTDDTIKVGAVLDMTGPAAYILSPACEAYRTYFHYVNDQGGLHGRKVKLIVEDDRYSIPMAVAAYKKLIYKDKVLAILSMGGSGQHKALYDQIEKDKIPVLSNIAWSYHVSNPLKRYSFHPSNDNIDEIKLMVDYIVKNVDKEKLRLAYVYTDHEVGKSGFGQLKESLKSYGLELLGKEVVDLAAFDASSQVLNLKRNRINFIISLTGAGGGLAMLRDAKRLGYFPVIMSSFHLIGDDTIQIVGQAAKNLLMIGSVGSWHDDEPGSRKMRDITLQHHSGSIEKFKLNRHYAKFWVTAMILAEGLKNAGRNLDQETLVAGLEKIKDLDTGGLMPPVSFSPTRRKAHDSGKFYKADIEKKHFITISGWVRPAH